MQGKMWKMIEERDGSEGCGDGGGDGEFVAVAVCAAKLLEGGGIGTECPVGIHYREDVLQQGGKAGLVVQRPQFPRKRDCRQRPVRRTEIFQRRYSEMSCKCLDSHSRTVDLALV